MKTYLSNFLGATAEFLRPLSISVGIPLSLSLFFWSRRPDAILICAQSRRLKVGAQTSQTVSRGRAANPLKASASKTGSKRRNGGEKNMCMYVFVGLQRSKRWKTSIISSIILSVKQRMMRELIQTAGRSGLRAVDVLARGSGGVRGGGSESTHTAAALSDSFAKEFDSTQPPAAAKQQAPSGPKIWHQPLLSCWRHLRQLSVKEPATRRRLLPPPFPLLRTWISTYWFCTSLLGRSQHHVKRKEERRKKEKQIV